MWIKINGSFGVKEFLSCVSMQCTKSAILFYQFCPSVRLSVCPMRVLCLN